MRPGRVVTVAVAVSLLAAGCADATGPGTTATTGSSPTATPGLSRPLNSLTSPEVLTYCPELAPVHFEGEPSDVADIYLCDASEIFETTGEGAAGDDDATGDDGAASDTDGAAASQSAGTRSLERASRVIAGGDALLEAYAGANATATDDMCIQVAADPLIVWIVGGGVTTAIYAPVDECGIPTASAAAAYASVTTETVAEVRIDAG